MELTKASPRKNKSSQQNNSSALSQIQRKEKNNKHHQGKKSVYRHIPHSEKPAHIVAKRNERERKRVQAVNSAFLRLRKYVPHEPRTKRLSKFKTLKFAIQYIQLMQDMIESHDWDNSPNCIDSINSNPNTDFSNLQKTPNNNRCSYNSSRGSNQPVARVEDPHCDRLSSISGFEGMLADKTSSMEFHENDENVKNYDINNHHHHHHRQSYPSSISTNSSIMGEIAVEENDHNHHHHHFHHRCLFSDYYQNSLDVSSYNNSYFNKPRIPIHENNTTHSPEHFYYNREDSPEMVNYHQQIHHNMGVDHLEINPNFVSESPESYPNPACYDNITVNSQRHPSCYYEIRKGQEQLSHHNGHNVAYNQSRHCVSEDNFQESHILDISSSCNNNSSNVTPTAAPTDLRNCRINCYSNSLESIGPITNNNSESTKYFLDHNNSHTQCYSVSSNCAIIPPHYQTPSISPHSADSHSWDGYSSEASLNCNISSNINYNNNNIEGIAINGDIISRSSSIIGSVSGGDDDDGSRCSNLSHPMESIPHFHQVISFLDPEIYQNA